MCASQAAPIIGGLQISCTRPHAHTHTRNNPHIGGMFPPSPDSATCLADLVPYKAVSEDYVTRINCSQGEGNRQARRSQLEANNVMRPSPFLLVSLSLPLSPARAEVGIVWPCHVLSVTWLCFLLGNFDNLIENKKVTGGSP